MKIIITIKDDICKNFSMECTPVEYLIINKALKQFSDNKENHKEDREKAAEMFGAEWIFKKLD